MGRTQTERVQDDGAEEPFVVKMEEVTWDWRKVHNAELLGSYCSQNIIGVINQGGCHGQGMSHRVEKKYSYWV
jgi:hypothetical protein